MAAAAAAARPSALMANSGASPPSAATAVPATNADPVKGSGGRSPSELAHMAGALVLVEPASAAVGCAGSASSETKLFFASAPSWGPGVQLCRGCCWGRRLVNIRSPGTFLIPDGKPRGCGASSSMRRDLGGTASAMHRGGANPLAWPASEAGGETLNFATSCWPLGSSLTVVSPSAAIAAALAGDAAAAAVPACSSLAWPPLPA